MEIESLNSANDTSSPERTEKHNQDIKMPSGGYKLFPDRSDSLHENNMAVSGSSESSRHLERVLSQEEDSKTYSTSTSAEGLKDLAKLSILREDTLNKCIQSRFQKDLIYTCCGDILISVNPFRDLGIYTQKEMDSYNQTFISKEPHVFMISAKAYQDLREKKRDQVILVSGESGAGKTEATKLLVQHLISLTGNYDKSLQEKIIQVNPVLENFGNAKTVLNINSSRFVKFIKLNYNENGMVQSAKIQDFVLEKYRVVYFNKGETTFHSFYAFLAGLPSPNNLYIQPGQTFRITGDFSTLTSRQTESYREKYDQQQKVFQMLNMAKEEIEDIHIILAAILHTGDIEFVDADDDCVIVKNEEIVQKVAILLDLDREKLTQALIQRKGKMARGEVIQFSKKKSQAEDERDALAKVLYEKLFGWLVLKMNDALAPVPQRNYGSIGILDICGFENLGRNSFEQLCINIINEHLQNFMNKKIIEDEKQLYEDEGISLGEIDTSAVNNDLVLEMFMKKAGILDSIDEDSKHEISANDVKMVKKLDKGFSQNHLYTSTTSERPEFSIKHFAGEVKYDGRTFIRKNRDILGELMEECLQASGSLLVKDLFHVQPSVTGSISMSQYNFQGSKRGGNVPYRPLTGNNLSQSINQSTKKDLQSRFGKKLPQFKNDFSNRKTHIFYFRNSLKELKRNMDSANPYFVRCIKPNNSHAPGKFDQAQVMSQLRYNGIIEIAHIRKHNLPVRMVKSEFIQRYKDLVPGVQNDHINEILHSVNAQPNTYKIGNSQVFMSDQVQGFLEEDLAELTRERDEKKKREEREKRLREEKEKQEMQRRMQEEEAKRRKEKEDSKKPFKQGDISELRRQQKKGREMRLRQELEGKQSSGEKPKIDELSEKKEPKDDTTFEKSIQTSFREGNKGLEGKAEELKGILQESIQRRRVEEHHKSDEENGNIEDERMKKMEEMRKRNALGKSVGFQLDEISEMDTPSVSTINTDYDWVLPMYKTSGPSNAFQVRTHDMESENTERETSFDEDDNETVSSLNEWIDHFQELTEEKERENIGNTKTMKVIKIFLYLFLALLLLASLVVQKISFINLVMDIRPTTESGNEDRQTSAYFMLILVICIPYGFSFFLSVLKYLFGISKNPSVLTWIWVLIIECLQTLGMCLLVFRVMRHLNYFKAAYLLSATVAFPSLVKLVTSDRKSNISTDCRVSRKRKVQQAIGAVFDLLAFAVQATSPFFIIWSDIYNKDPDKYEILELVGALVLVSANQWENFADGTLFGVELQDESWYKNKVLKIRYELQECRHLPNIVANVVKIGLTILLAYFLRDDIKLNYGNAFDRLNEHALGITFVSALIAVTISAFVAFNTSLVALKLQMQRFSFALPLCLALPVTVALLYLDCKIEFLQHVSQSGVESVNENLGCADMVIGSDWHQQIVFGVLWFLSLLVVCRHIWQQQLDRNSSMARLFLNPIYCGILTAEQIMLNQRRHQCKIDLHFKFDDDVIGMKSLWYKIARLTQFDSIFGEDENESIDGNENKPKHVTPKLYACATMWHETHDEMLQLLKSLHRLDLDQYLRHINQQPNVYDPNYYEYEAHIFFDDAMELDDDGASVLNMFVKTLVGCMSDACSSVHGKPIKVHDPVKMVTPYGGQLMWRMPGENLLFVHLKDITKVRNRKRWSQVMYMYYLLDYRLKMFTKSEALRKMEEINVCKGSHGLNIDELNLLLGEEHTAMSNKTYLLALDGDTDFNPSSVHTLMKKMDEEDVAAICGRVHPIGTGPMVWYQKFEYAISHWFQKAAESVFGCVLCSPGCFSLYRAKALMDTNVIKKYTREAKEPANHLQYDQGEDRWMCTLLLQRGYRIEYAASANAWTQSPEGFFEFYNQRRRWMPSAYVNAADLLNSSDTIRKINPNISLPYIIYTWLMLVMAILGPGTILLMIAGSIQFVFDIGILSAYVWALVPTGLYIIACFWLKSRWQLIIAIILSVIYAFIMLIVIVGIIVTASEENIFHPSVVTMLILIVIFVITGFCHPKEFGILIHGLLYVITIPSGYLLLVIYSICNLHVVSWGTREILTKDQRLKMQNKRLKKEQDRLNKKGFFKRMFDRGESYTMELANLLKAGTNNPNENIVDLLKSIDNNTKELLQHRSGNQSMAASSSLQPLVSNSTSDMANTQNHQALAESIKYTPPSDAEDKSKPFWTRDKALGNGALIEANEAETNFWKGLVENYLYPIRPTPEMKRTTKEGLRDLRNSFAFGFIIVNGLWIALFFMFQWKDAASIKLSYEFGDSDYNVKESVLGMSFVFVLVIFLILQFIGMILHRLGTLQQILSSTKIWGKSKDANISKISEIEDAIRHIKMILRMPAFKDEGIETEPPEAATKGNPLGLSIKPSARNFTLREDLGQSVRAIGMILDSTQSKQPFIDRKSLRTLTEVKKRLEGSRIHDRITGSSFRPNLPPRTNTAFQNTSAWLNKQSNWGITAKELRRLRPDQDIITSEPPIDYGTLTGVGALGRSLHFRAMAIQEEQAKLNAHKINWTRNDIRPLYDSRRLDSNHTA